jgi:hypothetical protein
MKTYAVRKSGSGYQVVWFYVGSLYGTEYDVENGYFDNLKDAENLECELSFQEV